VSAEKKTGLSVLPGGVPKPTITKSLQAIHFTVDPKTEMTLGAAKAFNAVNYLMQMKTHNSRLSAGAYKQLLGEGSVLLSVKSNEFMSLIGCSSRNFDYLKKLVGEIGKMRYSFDNNLTGDDMDYYFTNMFTSGRIVNGEVIFVIPPHTRDLLISEKPVAVIDFITLHANIESKYGMALNDLIQQEMYNCEETTKTFTLEDSVLRNALKIKCKEENGVLRYSYHQPHELKKKVLAVAIADYNQAGLEYRVTDYSYTKSLGVIYWTFSIEHISEHNRKAILAEMGDDILKASTALVDFKVSEHRRNQLITGIKNEFDLQYILYCIQLVKQKKPTNPAAYFSTVFDSNKQVFEEIWDVRKLEIEKERVKKAERHVSFLKQQKAEFKKQFFKAYAIAVADRYKTSKEIEPKLKEALIEHCKKLGRTLKAHEIIESINSNADIDFASPVFSAFYPDWIENNCQEELNQYVNSQTINITEH
jgi:hypothetical protein